MSIRTIFEINHDYAHKIDNEPEAFLTILRHYLNSGSKREAEALELYGLRRAWCGHHSTERRVVTAHDDVKL
jgi:hypothetical protein